MKRLIFYISLLFFTALPAVSFAESLSANITWDAPVMFEGGSPLDSTTITKYTIYDSGGGVVAEITDSGTTQHVFNLDASPGEELCFSLTATVERESLKSPPVCGVIPGRPAPPTSIRLEFSFPHG
jgi:hypothetical protein